MTSAGGKHDAPCSNRSHGGLPHEYSKTIVHAMHRWALLQASFRQQINGDRSIRASFHSTHRSSSMLSKSVWQPWASSTLYIEPLQALQDSKRSTSTPSQYDRSISGSQRPWADSRWMTRRNLTRYSGARSHGFTSAFGLATSSAPNQKITRNGNMSMATFNHGL